MRSLAIAVFRGLLLLACMACMGALFLIGPRPLLEWWETIAGRASPVEEPSRIVPLVDRRLAEPTRSAVSADASATWSQFAEDSRLRPLTNEPATVVPLPPPTQPFQHKASGNRVAVPPLPRPVFWASRDAVPARLPDGVPASHPMLPVADRVGDSQAMAAVYLGPNESLPGGPRQAHDSLDTMRFQHAQARLKQLGAVSYRLETWGTAGEQFRFQCKLASPGNPNYSRHFEAVDDEALTAIQRVIRQIEVWIHLAQE